MLSWLQDWLTRLRQSRRASTAEELMQLAVDETDCHFAIFDPDRVLVAHSRSYEALHEEAFASLRKPLRYDDLMRVAIRRTMPEADVDAELARRVAAHEGPGSSFDRLYAGGRWMRVLKRRLPGGYVAGLALDITELKRRETEAAAGEARYRALVETAPVGIWHLNEEGRTIFANARLAALFGGQAPECLEDAGIRRGADAATANGPFGFPPGREVEVTVPCRRSGAAAHLLIGASAWRAGEGGVPRSAILTVVDISPQKAAHARAEHLAWHDALTGLHNRARFAEMVRELAEARGGGALLLVDLDRFKDVNDTHGHAAGDAVLCTAAERMRRSVRDGDMVCRLGGDEFAIVARARLIPREAVALGERLVATLSSPYDIGEGRRARIGASVGVAAVGDEGEDAKALVERADLALYQAKGSGRGAVCLHQPGLEARELSRRGIRADLRAAFEGEPEESGFEVHYQPIIELATGRVSACEALVRWRHPTRGLISPAEFIPMAEDSGVIVELGTWVLRRACRDAAEQGWPEGVRVAVNVSPVQLRGRTADAFLREVSAALGATGMAAQRLELEITETVLLQDGGFAVREAIGALRALGARVALDDFGTGYSSLERLRGLPVDRLKIDAVFLQAGDELSARGNAAIVRAVTGLAAELGLRTTAEGVETAEALDLMREAGVDDVQGYFFYPPMTADGVTALFSPRPVAVGSAA